MKRFLLFVAVATLFAACSKDALDELQGIQNIVDEAPATLTVGFEDDETRIQLNSAQKTVWTNGDLVSVFYLSDANQQWQYTGETGARTAKLTRVNAGNATTTTTGVVVVYPYNENYYLNTRTLNVKASLPATQTYLKDSYGLDGNIMISQSEYNNISLKNVCGWLKLQLTGNGEQVKSITVRGNNGEQVAGELYINSADATATLASDMGDVTEDEGENATGGAGGNLVFEDTVLTEVTLNCGNGVTLGAEATAFYIALPPQTFAKGITVEITATNGFMTKSTDNEVVIERNHIKPMTAFAADLTVPETWKIYYTATAKVEPHNKTVFGATYVSNEWDSETGKGVITFEGDVTKIGDHAFYGYQTDCNKLTSVTIPDSVTTIGDYAFYWCYNLTSVTIPDSVTTIGESVFYSCTILTSVTIPEGVTTIGDEAFLGCDSLKSVTIPDSVTTIGEYAFYWSDNLTSVTIGKSVTTIGGYAFSLCTSLKEFKGKFAADGGRCLIIDGVLNAFAIGCGVTQYTIPDSATTIGEEAFRGCDSLTSVTIPDSVMTIGERAFYDCSSLKTVYCKPTTPPTGGYDMFYKYNGSEYLRIGCEIYVPASDDDSIINAYKEASGWSEYKDYIFEGPANNEIWYTATEKVEPYDKTVFGATYVSNEWDSETGNGVITFDGNVTKIGDWAFDYCTNLTSVTIPDSVTTIGIRAFCFCESLTSVTIPDSVTTIGNWAFCGCESLKEFKGKFAADNGRCLIMDNTIIAYAEASGTTYTIPDSVTTIGEQAFYGCTSLTSVTIPDSVTTIGEQAFYGCDSLASVTIGNSVTTIENYAFYYCTSLTSVTIPESVTTIENYAFYYCTSLATVYCKPTTPPTGGGYMFSYYDGWYKPIGCKIYVPASDDDSIINAYKKAWNWSGYADYIFEEEE